MSLIDELGALYLASRLERLSETLKKDAVLFFKSHLKDIKYKWYPPMYSIYYRTSIGVVELANELSYAHPSIIDILKELEEEKIVKSGTDKKDNRRRVLSLTAKGDMMMQEILPVTKAFEAAVIDLMQTKNNLLRAIEEIEERLEEENFYNRVKKRIKR